MFQIRFKPNRIEHWAARYVPGEDEADIVALAKRVRSNGFLTKPELIQFFDWKTRGRGRSRCMKNPDSYVKEITGISFSTKNEHLQIEILTLLGGVQWPVASAILHFVYPDKYPILDFRALWSLGISKVPPYDYAFWSGYCEYCRELASITGFNMRTVDRALWQYSKEKQNDG